MSEVNNHICTSRHNNSLDIDAFYNDMCENIVKCFDKCATFKEKSIFQYEKPLKLSKVTKMKIHERNNAYKKWKKHPNNNTYTSYAELNKSVKLSIKADQKAEIQCEIEKSGLWSVFTKQTKKHNRTLNTFSADDLNDHFVNICNSPTMSILDTSHITSKSDEHFTLKPITRKELLDAWKTMRNKQSASEDYCGISNKMIDTLMKNRSFLTYLLSLINAIITQNNTPSKLKVAKIVAIPKVPNPTSISDMRPISILCVIAKLLEKCVYAQMKAFLFGQNILSQFRFGFRPHHNTELAELCVHNIVNETLINKDQMCAIITFDIAKAFDTVNREFLYQKLDSYSINSQWFRSYLSNRAQYVTTDSTSKLKYTLRGVPQGGCLSGVLFAIFINDICTKHAKHVIVLYVDDSQIIFKIDKNNIKHSLQEINSIVAEIASWYNNNDLKINPKKTECIVFCKKNDAHLTKDLHLEINGHLIHTSKQIKSLGLVKNMHDTWNDYIAKLTTKCNKLLWTLRAFRNKLTFCKLQTLTEALILSNIRYMIILYGKSNNKVLQPLNKILMDTYNLVTNGNQKTSDEWTWLNTKELHKLSKCVLAFKSRIGTVPQCFDNLVNENAIEECVTRHRKYNAVHRDKCISSVQFEFTNEWSRIPYEITLAKDTKTFCKLMKRHLINNRIKRNDNEHECDNNIIDDVFDAVCNMYKNNDI